MLTKLLYLNVLLHIELYPPPPPPPPLPLRSILGAEEADVRRRPVGGDKDARQAQV